MQGTGQAVYSLGEYCLNAQGSRIIVAILKCFICLTAYEGFRSTKIVDIHAGGNVKSRRASLHGPALAWQPTDTPTRTQAPLLPDWKSSQYEPQEVHLPGHQEGKQWASFGASTGGNLVREAPSFHRLHLEQSSEILIGGPSTSQWTGKPGAGQALQHVPPILLKEAALQMQREAADPRSECIPAYRAQQHMPGQSDTASQTSCGDDSQTHDSQAWRPRAEVEVEARLKGLGLAIGSSRSHPPIKPPATAHSINATSSKPESSFGLASKQEPSCTPIQTAHWRQTEAGEAGSQHVRLGSCGGRTDGGRLYGLNKRQRGLLARMGSLRSSSSSVTDTSRCGPHGRNLKQKIQSSAARRTGHEREKLARMRGCLDPEERNDAEQENDRGSSNADHHLLLALQTGPSASGKDCDSSQASQQARPSKEEAKRKDWFERQAERLLPPCGVQSADERPQRRNPAQGIDSQGPATHSPLALQGRSTRFERQKRHAEQSRMIKSSHAAEVCSRFETHTERDVKNQTSSSCGSLPHPHRPAACTRFEDPTPAPQVALQPTTYPHIA